MMKTLLSLLMMVCLSLVGAGVGRAEGKGSTWAYPRVLMYEIRKYGVDGVKEPVVILELSNPTERMYYIEAERIGSPVYHMEVRRGDEWLLGGAPECGTGLRMFAMRPGTKMLVAVTPTWKEEATRFRFFFYRGDGDVVSVRSGVIERKDLGEVGEARERLREELLKQPLLTDAELNDLRGKGWREMMSQRTAGNAKKGAEEAGRGEAKDGSAVPKDGLAVPKDGPAVPKDGPAVPKVGIYEIRRFEDGEYSPHLILEVSNPTDRKFYFDGYRIVRPFCDREVKRGEKWLVDPWVNYDPSVEVFTLRPGARILVSVDPSWDDETMRFRFLFSTSRDFAEGEVFSVRSREIERKELGEDRRDEWRKTQPRELKEMRTDEEVGKLRREKLGESK